MTKILQSSAVLDISSLLIQNLMMLIIYICIMCPIVSTNNLLTDWVWTMQEDKPVS